MDIQEFLKQLKEYGIVNRIPNISQETARYITAILKERKVQNMLEIGTANGYSTIQFANSLQNWGGHITTIEFSQKAYESAKQNFQAIELTNIEQILGDARELIPNIEKAFDCIFIDGMKRLTKDFFLLSRKKIQSGGIIIIDDVVKFRSKMEDFYEYLDKENIPHTVIMTDPDDGIMLIEC